MIDKVLDRLIGFRKPVLPLVTQPLPLIEIELPKTLSFLLKTTGAPNATSLVEAGEEIKPGRMLGRSGETPILPSPVAGKVVTRARVPDIRGTLAVDAIVLEPTASGGAAAFEKLDPAGADPSQLRDRIREAGIITNALNPRPLLEIIGSDGDTPVETLIILAADQEPDVGAQLQVFMERGRDIPSAAELLRKLSGAKRIVLAIFDEQPQEAAGFCEATVIETLFLEPRYPNALAPLVIHAAKAGEQTCVVSLETAIAALDAVRDGRVQDTKMVTVIGPDGPIGNCRAPIGTRIRDLLVAAGLSTHENDKVLAGGAMRGTAQFSLESVVDAGMDALVVIPEAKIKAWSDEPCINCGACIRVCPADLQVQLIGRYAEFELFDRAEEMGMTHCIECGLCASVCTARRPLLQFIRLARNELQKHEIQKQRAAQLAAEAEEAEAEAASGTPDEDPAEEAKDNE